MEANWTDPLLFFIYSVAKPVVAALILVVMLEVIAGGGQPTQYRAFVVVGQRALVVRHGRHRRAWPGRSSTTASATGCSSTSTSARATSWSSCSAAGSRGSPSGRWARVITLVVGVIVARASPFDLAAVDWPLLVVVMASGPRRRSSRSACCSRPICLQTRQESWSYPEAVAGALFLVPAPSSRSPSCRSPLQAIGLLEPADLVARGRPAGASSRPGRRGIGGPGSLWTAVTGTAAPDAPTIVVALLVTGAWLHSRPPSSSARASAAPRIAG